MRGNHDETAKDNEYAGSSGVNIDALLAAINEISESEVQRTRDDPYHVSINGRSDHTWRELAEAFELDIHDFSITEANR